jgi:tetratricopeptide (TPR) repeat protein
MTKLNHVLFSRSADWRSAARPLALVAAAGVLVALALWVGRISVSPEARMREALDNRRYDDAIAIGQKILSEDPASIEAHLGLAEAYGEKAGLGQSPEASAKEAVKLVSAVASAEGGARARRALGQALWRAGDLDGAEREYRAALAADPGDALSEAYLAEVYLEQGRVAEARELGRQAFLVGATIPEVRLSYARLSVGLRDPDAAAEIALPIADDSRPRIAAEANYLVSSALISVGKVDEARAAAARALELAPDSARVVQNYGDLVFAELLGPYGREFDQALDEAGSYADRAIALDSRLALPHLLAFKVAHSRGDDPDAARRAATVRDRLPADRTLSALQRGEVLAFVAAVLGANATPIAND